MNDALKNSLFKGNDLKKLTIVIGLRKKSLRRADSFYMMRSNISIDFCSQACIASIFNLYAAEFFHLNWNC